MSRENTLKIALVQWMIKDPRRPREQLMRFLKRAQGYDLGDSDILVFPELWTTGPIEPQEAEVFEETPEILFELQAFSGELGAAIQCGLPEAQDREGKSRRFNTVFFIQGDRPPVAYRKVHLFPPFGEDKVFSKGHGPVPFWTEVKGKEWGIGPLVCYDLRFPEISREYAVRGCFVLVCHALWPRERIGHFKSLLKARAIENQCFVVGVNALGRVKGIDFGGNSCVFAPDGTELLSAGEDEGIYSCELNLSLLYETRKRFHTVRPRSWEHCASSKVVSLKDIKTVVERRRRAGQSCVFTNGCFDLLHAGHVAYLEEARSLGDFLVVGLNSDASIKGIKGPFRPINPEAMRASVLAGLEAVDYVVIFHEPTPIEVIKRVLPDCLVKGEDWDEDAIVGAQIVKSRGGKVVRIPFVHDVSTTKIIGRIKKGMA